MVVEAADATSRDETEIIAKSKTRETYDGIFMILKIKKRKYCTLPLQIVNEILFFLSK